jgi:hypothetical protein
MINLRVVLDRHEWLRTTLFYFEQILSPNNLINIKQYEHF